MNKKAFIGGENPMGALASPLNSQNMSWPDQHELMRAVATDGGLSVKQKQQLLEEMQDPSFMQRMFAGGAGAALALAIARYMKISPQAQILLSMAGFGIGNLLLDSLNKKNNVMKYNEKLKTYEISQS